jgi:hypothetical protein
MLGEEETFLVPHAGNKSKDSALKDLITLFQISFSLCQKCPINFLVYISEHTIVLVFSALNEQYDNMSNTIIPSLTDALLCSWTQA